MSELNRAMARLVRRWGVLAITMALGAGGGLLYATLTPPAYTTSAVVVVAGDEATGSDRDVSYAQAYGRLIGQQDMADRAGAAAGVSADAVLRAVRASTSPDAPVIDLIGTDTDPQRAATLVNAVAEELVRTAGARRTDTGVRMFVLSSALPPAGPSSPSLPVGVAVGVAAGFLLGGLFVLASTGRRTDEEPDHEAGQAGRGRMPSPVDHR